MRLAFEIFDFKQDYKDFEQDFRYVWMIHTNFYSKILMLDISKWAVWDFQFQQDFQKGITRFQGVAGLAPAMYVQYIYVANN